MHSNVHYMLSDRANQEKTSHAKKLQVLFIQRVKFFGGIVARLSLMESWLA